DGWRRPERLLLNPVLRQQEDTDDSFYRVRLLKLRRVAGVVDHLDARAWNPACELFGIDGRHELVVGAPDHERGRFHAMDTLLQPLVRNWPDEFPGGAHRPHDAHACERVVVASKQPLGRVTRRIA